MYTLQLKIVPNFNSLGLFSFSSAGSSCYQLLIAVTKKIKWDFQIPPKADTCAKLQLCRLSQGLARACDTVHAPGPTPGKTNATQTQLSWCLGLS